METTTPLLNPKTEAAFAAAVPQGLTFDELQSLDNMLIGDRNIARQAAANAGRRRELALVLRDDATVDQCEAEIAQHTREEERATARRRQLTGQFHRFIAAGQRDSLRPGHPVYREPL
ncbi:MAG TPA: hypothetical protein VKS60_21985 [Stellaceae bacterium]|nr:hypothetical protein [Stellaceae bacterium]